MSARAILWRVVDRELDDDRWRRVLRRSPDCGPSLAMGLLSDLEGRSASFRDDEGYEGYADRSVCPPPAAIGLLVVLVACCFVALVYRGKN